MARFKFGRPVSLRWNGLLIEGPAETTFEIPDEYYEEFNEDIGGVEPTLVWLDADEGSTLRARVTALELASGSFAILDAKGDLISATADNTAARLGVGANGTILTADSSTATGLAWTAPSAVASSAFGLKQYVKNTSGVTIDKGRAVYVTGATGTNVTVGLADYDADVTSSKTLGLMETTVAHNGFGYVVTEGILTGFDTTAASTEGVPVWLGASGTLIYGSAPSEPYHTVYIGVVSRKNVSNGEVFIKVQNGYELTELHDVSAAAPADNDILQFDNTSGYWKNETLANAGISATSHNHTGTYSETSHNHAGTYSETSHNHTGTYANISHTHAQSDVTSLTSTLAGKSDTGHNHNGTYDPAGTSSAAITTHESAANPHPTYLTAAEGDAAYATVGHTHALGAPTGAIAMWPTATAPTGWLFLDGSTYNQSTYPTLAAVFGVSSGTFTLPDMRDRFAAGLAAVGSLSNNAGTFAPNTANSIAHTHTTDIAHGHADTIAVSTHGDHTHTTNPAAVTSAGVSPATTYPMGTSTANSVGAHTHSVDVAATTSGAENTNLTHTVTGGVTSLGTTSITSSAMSANGTVSPKSTLLNFIIKT